MIEVRFRPDDRVAWLAAGTTLVDAGAAAGVEIVTGCTRGMCGTDAVRIDAGGDALLAAGDDERSTLERMGLEVGPWRLACSARLADGAEARGPVVVDPTAF